ncbi:MAG: hypothetical protein SVO01_00260 [Thermotogota bacterium]|nr:hypothetical protein [Thermotogota bacterium]
MDHHEEERNQLEKTLLFFLKGDILAVKFCLDCWFVAHIWDDIIDKDTNVKDKDVNKAFKKALIDIPSNPFYIQNRNSLTAIILNAMLQWQDANVLEKGSLHDKHMAYMLRACMIQAFCFCAYLVGGQEWYDAIGPDLRRIYSEKLEDFIEEMEKCQQQQQQ